MLVRKVTILPLEVIIRNISAGSMAKRLDPKRRYCIWSSIFEFCYKRDDLGDPLINDDHAIALGIVTREEVEFIKQEAFKINEILKDFFMKANLKLVDFKIEYGKTEDGEIILADEISPDTCRLWDKDTDKKLDKDRFRRDLGSVIEGYQKY